MRRQPLGSAPGDCPCRRRGSILKAELGRDHDLVANRCQSLPDDFLIREGTVGLRGIEESYPHVERGSDDRNGALLVETGPVGKVSPCSQTRWLKPRDRLCRVCAFALRSPSSGVCNCDVKFQQPQRSRSIEPWYWSRMSRRHDQTPGAQRPSGPRGIPTDLTHLRDCESPVLTTTTASHGPVTQQTASHSLSGQCAALPVGEGARSLRLSRLCQYDAERTLTVLPTDARIIFRRRAQPGNLAISPPGSVELARLELNHYLIAAAMVSNAAPRGSRRPCWL